MAPNFPVDAYHADVTQIVGDVFRTMLSLDPRPVENGSQPRPNPVTAAIYFAGAWKGAVVVEASEALARGWTATLMSIAEPEEVNDDVRDAMGELVNMIGGNLKSILPGGVGLSMPSVVQGRDYSMRICGGNQTCRQSFQASGAEAFWVTLVEVIDG